jgi:hypothetical protein
MRWPGDESITAQLRSVASRMFGATLGRRLFRWAKRSHHQSAGSLLIIVRWESARCVLVTRSHPRESATHVSSLLDPEKKWPMR